MQREETAASVPPVSMTSALPSWIAEMGIVTHVVAWQIVVVVNPHPCQDRWEDPCVGAGGPPMRAQGAVPRPTGGRAPLPHRRDELRLLGLHLPRGLQVFECALGIALNLHRPYLRGWHGLRRGHLQRIERVVVRSTCVISTSDEADAAEARRR